MDSGESIYTLYSDVNSIDVKWLWYPFFAKGKITILQGDPGDGKSSMMMQLIAELTTGGTAPDGTNFVYPHRVIYQCSEDGVADTIKPRLELCGADCSKVAFINEEIHDGLTVDDERIREAIISFRPQLVVIDPLQAYLESSMDLQIAGKTRRLMRRLAMWASTYDCAIVLIGHLNKNEGRKGIYRSLGSIDVIAAARSVLHVERDEEDPGLRIVTQIKNSLAPTGSEIHFSFEKGKLVWGECFIVSKAENNKHEADEIEVPEFASKRDKAAYLIKYCLANGDMPSQQVYSILKEKEISHRLAELTKTEMGVRCYRKNKKWFWSLKNPDDPSAKGNN